MNKIERIKIGYISVDAGLCWVGDPCYVLGDHASSRVHDWMDFCNKLGDGNYSAPLGDGTGFAISTGYGDGSYPVYVEISDEGSWGKRVAKIIVDFFPEDEENEDESW